MYLPHLRDEVLRENGEGQVFEEQQLLEDVRIRRALQEFSFGDCTLCSVEMVLLPKAGSSWLV